MGKSNIIDHRVDFVLVFSVDKCSPQGDPYADNAPRQDSMGYGMMSPQGIKRMIRDFLASQGFRIHVSRGAVLETNIREAVGAAKLNAKADVLKSNDEKAVAIHKLNEIFWDCRTFGGVLGKPIIGRQTGPIQLSVAQSVEPIDILNMGITRVCIQNEKDQDRKDSDLGRMPIVDFGLYRQTGSVSPRQAVDTGCTWEDYDNFIQAALHMFDESKSATRSGMVLERLYEFHHPGELGKIGSHKLHRAVKTVRLNPGTPPHSIDDYSIYLDESAIPKDIEVRIHE